MSRVAVVTGGTRGIGAEISKALKKTGYKVVASYNSNDEAAEEFKSHTKVEVLRWNAANFEACQTRIELIEKEYGPVDVVVNNAGITRDTTFHKMTHEHWQQVIDVNLGSCFNMCRAVIEGMREREYGRIINISSINGLKGQLGQVNYSAAKAGMIGFTKALALEGARKGITVNAIAPGYVNTEMVQAVPEKVLNSIISDIPVQRLAEPEEIARLVVFLAAEESGFITGATFNINGGQYMQ